MFLIYDNYYLRILPVINIYYSLSSIYERDI